MERQVHVVINNLATTILALKVTLFIYSNLLELIDVQLLFFF